MSFIITDRNLYEVLPGLEESFYFLPIGHRSLLSWVCRGLDGKLVLDSSNVADYEARVVQPVYEEVLHRYEALNRVEDSSNSTNSGIRNLYMFIVNNLEAFIRSFLSLILSILCPSAQKRYQVTGINWEKEGVNVFTVTELPH